MKKPDDGTLVPKPVAYTTFNFFNLYFILIKNLLAMRRTVLIQVLYKPTEMPNIKIILLHPLCFSTLMAEAKRLSETLVPTYHPTRRHIPISLTAVVINHWVRHSTNYK
jgi:hypothetical protein